MLSMTFIFYFKIKYKLKPDFMTWYDFLFEMREELCFKFSTWVYFTLVKLRKDIAFRKNTIDDKGDDYDGHQSKYFERKKSISNILKDRFFIQRKWQWFLSKKHYKSSKNIISYWEWNKIKNIAYEVVILWT